MQKDLLMDEEPQKLIQSMGSSQVENEEAIEEEEGAADAENREEQELYNSYLQNFKQEFFKINSGDGIKTPFDFNRVTQDVSDFKSLYDKE